MLDLGSVPLRRQHQRSVIGSAPSAWGVSRTAATSCPSSAQARHGALVGRIHHDARGRIERCSREVRGRHRQRGQGEAWHGGASLLLARRAHAGGGLVERWSTKVMAFTAGADGREARRRARTPALQKPSRSARNARPWRFSTSARYSALCGFQRADAARARRLLLTSALVPATRPNRYSRSSAGAVLRHERHGHRRWIWFDPSKILTYRYLPRVLAPPPCAHDGQRQSHTPVPAGHRPGTPGRPARPSTAARRCSRQKLFSRPLPPAWRR